MNTIQLWCQLIVILRQELPNIYESELVDGKVPPSSVEESTSEEEPPTTVNIAKSLDDLEDMLLEIQAAFKSKLHADQMTSYFDRSASLELTLEN